MRRAGVCLLVLLTAGQAKGGIWDQVGWGVEERKAPGDAATLDELERRIADGDWDAGVLARSAALLMTAGRAGAAIDRYREAVAIEEREPNRREHVRGIARSYFGLAVALDREGHAVASREAMGRGLALDPGLASLRAAPSDSGAPGVGAGEQFYYLALAREAQGRTDDAEAALRNYLRVASGPYAVRARERLAGLMRAPRPAGAKPSSDVRGARLRVVHQATIVAEGPLVAPLIDAAWRLDRRLLEACLSDAPATGGQQFKLSLDLRIEATGRVSAVTVTAPPALGDTLPRCIEEAVLNRFRVTRPHRPRPTRVRMDLVLAPAAPGGV